MLRLVKKTAFIGLGLAAMSLAALEQLGRRIANEANLSEKEGEKLIDDLIEQSKKSRDEMMAMFEKTVQDSLSNMNVVTSQDLEAIDKRLAKIEKSIGKNKE